MAGGRARISLNEITFGSTVFAGCTEMLRFAVGSRNASRILVSGALYSAEEARQLGLIDEVCNRDDVLAAARMAAAEMAAKSGAAFAGIKRLLRAPIAAEMQRREELSILDFLEVWHSPRTRAALQKIVIRE
jgi:enoyl-CoA hydratase/carnithine racemase